MRIDTVKKFDKIKAAIKTNNSAIGITAEFDVHFTADVVCVRCLDIFSREFSTDLHLVYFKGKDPSGQADKVDLRISDADRVCFDGAQIDLGVGIREAIVLSMSIVLLCKDKCRGLCPVCGINKNKKTCKCKVDKNGLFTPVSIKKKAKRKRDKKR